MAIFRAQLARAQITPYGPQGKSGVYVVLHKDAFGQGSVDVRFYRWDDQAQTLRPRRNGVVLTTREDVRETGRMLMAMADEWDQRDLLDQMSDQEPS